MTILTLPSTSVRDIAILAKLSLSKSGHSKFLFVCFFGETYGLNIVCPISDNVFGSPSALPCIKVFLGKT